jgi:hypothetical protein
MMSTDYSQLPYGLYESRNSITFFNRHYQPIIKLEYDEHPVFDSWQNGAGSLRIGAPRVMVVDPKTRIIFSGQRWFYSDANPPSRNKQTRQRLEQIIQAIPELRREIARRSQSKVPA